MRKSLWLLGLIGVAAFGEQAAAQVPGIDLHIGGRIGYFMPLGIVGEDATDRETTVSNGLALGASIELDIPVSPINLRATLDATFGRSLEVEELDVADTSVDIITLTGDLVFRPIPRLVLAQPYLLLGAGFKRYSADGGIEDQTDFTGHLGAGADLSLGVASLMVEVSDYISSLESVDGGDSRLQNDVFIMVGLRIGIL
jgi:hypothetical protein